jgi:glutathione S-transferase
MTSELILHYAPDNASLCVRLTLLELGIPFKTHLVDRRRNGQNDPAYLALNPNGLIPTLETPDGPIYETAAILLWLADSCPSTALPAPDAPARGAALSRLFWLSNTMHPTLRRLFYPSVYAPGAESILQQRCQADLAAQFQQLETIDAPWIEAEDPSILACYLAPMLRWPAIYGGASLQITKDAYPRLHDFALRFEARPAMQAAMLAEGLGPTPISAPQLPNPPEGTAT